MADLKALKNRISATRSNAKIFHAQELIATSRITLSLIHISEPTRPY